MPESIPKIHIDSNLHQTLSSDLLELVIEEALSKPARCLARFTNIETDREGKATFKYFSLADFNFGDQLEVWVGVPPVTLYRLFNGRIQLIEAVYNSSRAPEILIQSEDAFQQMKRKIRTRLFQDAADADVIASIATDYGLTADIDLAGSTHRQLTQLNQSDFDFLAERVREAGGEMRLDGNQLIARTHNVLDFPELTLSVGDELLNFQVRADLRDQSTSLGVAGWDMRSKEPLRQSSDENDLPDSSGSLDGGGRTTEKAFGQSLANLVDTNPTSGEEAKNLARVYYREKARRFITGTGLSNLSWELKAGRKVTITKAGELFDGVYTITSVRHRYDQDQGLRTEFEVERSFIGTAERRQPEKKDADK